MTEKPGTNQISADDNELSDSPRQVESNNWRSIQSLLAIMASTSDVKTILDSADSVFILLNQFDDQTVAWEGGEESTNSVLTKHDTSVHEDRKRIILYTVSKLMDHSNPRVLLKLSAIILKVCTSTLLDVITILLLILYPIFRSVQKDCFF